MVMVLPREKISSYIISYIRKLPPNDIHSLVIYKTVYFLLTRDNTLSNYMQNANGIHFDLENIDVEVLVDIQKYIKNITLLLEEQKVYEKKREHFIEEYAKTSKNDYEDSLQEAIIEEEETEIVDFEEEIKNGFKKKHFNIKKEFQRYKKPLKRKSDIDSETCSIQASYKDQEEEYSNKDFSDEDDLFGDF